MMLKSCQTHSMPLFQMELFSAFTVRMHVAIRQMVTWTFLLREASRQGLKEGARRGNPHPVRAATVGVKCAVLCVSSQSGWLCIADSTTGTSAACRMSVRPRLTASAVERGTCCGGSVTDMWLGFFKALGNQLLTNPESTYLVHYPGGDTLP